MEINLNLFTRDYRNCISPHPHHHPPVERAKTERAVFFSIITGPRESGTTRDIENSTVEKCTILKCAFFNVVALTTRDIENSAVEKWAPLGFQNNGFLMVS